MNRRRQESGEAVLLDEISRLILRKVVREPRSSSVTKCNVNPRKGKMCIARWLIRFFFPLRYFAASNAFRDLLSQDSDVWPRIVDH